MVKILTASKSPLDFELHISEKVEVKPLSNEVISNETMALLARMHQVFIEMYCIQRKQHNLVDVAIRYFENKGFELKEVQGT